MLDRSLAKVRRCPYCHTLGISKFRSTGRGCSSFEYALPTVRFPAPASMTDKSNLGGIDLDVLFGHKYECFRCGLPFVGIVFGLRQLHDEVGGFLQGINTPLPQSGGSTGRSRVLISQRQSIGLLLAGVA